MAENEYDNNYAGYITTAGGTPSSSPPSIKDVLKSFATLIASAGGGLGTVTSVSVASANGVAGTVATATTTPGQYLEAA
jgi:hypothetical protein